ncbi:uncharacterized protein LOC124144336 [Haliotis rufescens]|uniref:uncharacterized protein LOC124144336 n=1 Tax=Haliotis rufescens TaxID=6454 RepID=UPI00201F5F2A|nr:uncharacterized protein LOC124144336 [Haliotis rufescens]
MQTDRVYVNWRGVDHTRQTLSLNRLYSRDSWDRDDPVLIHTFSQHTCHTRPRSIGNLINQPPCLPMPCEINSYYNFDQQEPIYSTVNNTAKKRAICFENSLFDETAYNLIDDRKYTVDVINMSADGTPCLLPEMQRPLHLTGGEPSPVTFRNRPRPCLSTIQPENIYEPVGNRRAVTAQQPVHGQYISFERALSMDETPPIPPRDKINLDQRDSFLCNMARNERVEHTKSYDKKICLPRQMQSESMAGKLSCQTKQRATLNPCQERMNSCCRNCKSMGLTEQPLSLSETYIDMKKAHRETGAGLSQNMEWDYYDIGKVSSEQSTAMTQTSEFEHRQPKILSRTSSIDTLSSVATSIQTPAWFDDLITTSFANYALGNQRHSRSMGTLPESIGSMDFTNNIKRDQRVFAKTHMYQLVKSQFRRDGHIVITGRPGTGKTAMAYQILRDIVAEGATPIVVDSPGDFPDRKPSGNVIILIDDMFGSYKYEEHDIDLWNKILKKLEGILDEQTRKQNRHLSFFFICTSRTYVLREALPFLGKYNSTIFSSQYIVDLGKEDGYTNVERMNILDNHTQEGTLRGNTIDRAEKEDIIHCSTYAFPQTCQLYSASQQLPGKSLLFFQWPVKYLVDILEPLYLSDKKKFAALLLIAIYRNKLNITPLSNDKNVDDDFKESLRLAEKYTDVKDKKLSPSEIYQDLKIMTGSFVSLNGDSVSFLHPVIYDAVVYIVGERSSEFVLKHSTMRFIYDRVRLIPSTESGIVSRPTEGDRSQFLLHLAPAHFQSLAKRFGQEISAGHFALVCAHEACVLPEFVEILFDYLKRKGRVARSASKLSKRLGARSTIHNSDVMYGGKFLYWTVWNKSMELCKIFLEKLLFTKREKCQAVIGCSLSGNVQAMSLLLDSLGSEHVTYELDPTMPYLMMDQPERAQKLVLQIVILGSTPLHIASERGRLGIVKLLLSRDFDINEKGPRVAATPLHYACQGGHMDVVCYLLQNGAEINSPDWVLRTPLHWAASCGESDIVKILTFNSAHLDVKDDEGLTPLHCAAWGGHLQTCITLLNGGASPKVRTRYNKTPLEISIDESFRRKFQDTIVFDFDCYVDNSGQAAFRVGLRGPLILSVAASAIMIKRPRNHEILFEWTFRSIRRFGHTEISFKFEAGRNCETGEGVFILLTVDGDDIMECIRMRLKSQEESADPGLLVHRRAPPMY